MRMRGAGPRPHASPPLARALLPLRQGRVELVFSTGRGPPCNDSNLPRFLKPAASWGAVAARHALRRTHAAYYHRVGGSVPETLARMGHVSPRMILST